MSIANRKANGVVDRLDQFIEARSAATAFLMAQMTKRPALEITRLLDAASLSAEDTPEQLRARLNLNLLLAASVPNMRRRMSASMRKHAMGLVT